MLPNFAFWAIRDYPMDAGEKLGPLLRLKHPVIGECPVQIDELVSGSVKCPEETFDNRGLESADPLQLGHML